MGTNRVATIVTAIGHTNRALGGTSARFVRTDQPTRAVWSVQRWPSK
jgi:hypothetical protein